MDLKDIRMAFGRDSRLKSAFRAVKIDLDLLAEKNDSLKRSTNEWTLFLNHENQELKRRVKELERKTQLLEKVVDYEKLAVLREL